MPFKFQAPIKMPRFTRDEFILKKQEYVAKYGYTVHIPGFEDIFTWNVTAEPTPAELQLYRQKKVNELGEVRYFAIKALMAKKRENYLKMLSSPTPQVVQNAASVLTALDDVNDVLGTIAVVARIVARRLPAVAAKFLLGPAGWALVGADIAGLALELTSLPFKARRLQHELNDAVKGNPLSKKAKLKRLNKLKRLSITKGELIEALQTTDNMFGVGISLGGIMGMLTEIPAGLYQHSMGKKVTIVGLPSPLYWFDRQWSRLLKSVAYLFWGHGVYTDRDLNMGIVAAKFASDAAHTYLNGVSPLDAIPDVDNISLMAPTPGHPSTQEVITQETPAFQKYIGWIQDSSLWKNAARNFDEIIGPVQDNLGNWIDRNKNSMEGLAAAQHMVDTGPNILAALEGDDSIEMSYDAVAEALLQLMNVNLRFPEQLTQVDVLCWSDKLSLDYDATGGVNSLRSRQIAREDCGFEFTTEVPDRPTPTDEELLQQRLHNIDGLRSWYFHKVIFLYEGMKRAQRRGIVYPFERFEENSYKYIVWLRRYGFEEGEPAAWRSTLNLLQLEFYSLLFPFLQAVL